MIDDRKWRPHRPGFPHKNKYRTQYSWQDAVLDYGDGVAANPFCSTLGNCELAFLATSVHSSCIILLQHFYACGDVECHVSSKLFTDGYTNSQSREYSPMQVCCNVFLVCAVGYQNRNTLLLCPFFESFNLTNTRKTQSHTRGRNSYSLSFPLCLPLLPFIVRRIIHVPSEVIQDAL